MGDKSHNAEIAFFGGSFTAIDRNYMLSLLEATVPYISEFEGIRISTRPDCIDNEVLEILKKYKVSSIELGAQSMDDEVLLANRRGHTSDDVINASRKISEYGFSLGLQMMTGLYKSSYEKDLATAKEFIRLKPDTVRIYPTVIMKDTELAGYYLSGDFVPYTLEKSVELCSELITLFEENNINIIRLGLHYSDSLINNSYGNNYHPAFKELCESRIFYNKFISMANNVASKNITATINPKSVSKFLGQKKSNLNLLNNIGYNIKLEYDNNLSKYDLILKQGAIE